VNALKTIAVTLCRFLLAAVFIFSGFVKAVDPMGTHYKIADYLTAMHMTNMLPEIATVTIAVLLAATEFCLGIFLLFAIQRRMTSRLILLFMLVMTPLTLWTALADPVSDCGCFGDAVVLTNWQTFGKNVVLLTAAIVVTVWPRRMARFVSASNQWIVTNYSALFILAIAALSLYDLPLFDFRPYHIGANIKQGMEIPEEAEKPVFETTFILEKDGKRQMFTLDNYPDSTWTFVDTKTVTLSKGYVPPIHDFSVVTADGEDITNNLLADTSYVFLLVAPYLEEADDARLDLINELSEYAREHSYTFVGLTGSNERAIARWRDRTGADYDFCTTDPTTLKTIIRSNPGLVLLKQGTVIRKWSHNNLPVIDEEQMSTPLERLEEGQMPIDSVPVKLMWLLMWFVMPLVLLTIADRMWMWSKWIRKKVKLKKMSILATQEKAKENNQHS